jgi:hypothetical protein
MSILLDGLNGITTPAETVQGALTTTGNTILGDATTDTLNVGAGGLVKDSSGNVGIGTSSPSSGGLEVNKLLASEPHVVVATPSSAHVVKLGWDGGGVAQLSTATNHALRFATNNTERMRIDTNGNVGIGATPNSGTYNKELTLSSGAGQFCGLSIQNTTTGTSGGFTAYISNTLAYLFNRSNDALLLGTNNTERMRIDSSGNLLVGATTTINGRKTLVAYNDTLHNGLGINETTGASGAQFQAFFSNGTSCGTIVRVGATSAVTYGTASDYRLKKNILPMVGALEKVLTLKPCTYTWKDCDIDSQGFIAHELAEVCPDAVQGEKDASEEEQYEVTPAAKDEEGNIVTEAVMGTRIAPIYQGIDTSFLVATLTAAIQELKSIVDAQAVRIAALEA